MKYFNKALKVNYEAEDKGKRDIRKSLLERVDQSILKWFGHMKGINDRRFTKRI